MEDKFRAFLESDTSVWVRDPTRVMPEFPKMPYYTHDENSCTYHTEIKKSDINDFITIYFPLLFS